MVEFRGVAVFYKLRENCRMTLKPQAVNFLTSRNRNKEDS